MCWRQPLSTLFPYTTLFRSTKHPREALIAALRRVKVVPRGPKPVAVLRELGISPALMVPEPNTWRELLRSEEHTSELQSHSDLVCRLLLEKKKNNVNNSKVL